MRRWGWLGGALMASVLLVHGAALSAKRSPAT